MLSPQIQIRFISNLVHLLIKCIKTRQILIKLSPSWTVSVKIRFNHLLMRATRILLTMFMRLPKKCKWRERHWQIKVSGLRRRDTFWMCITTKVLHTMNRIWKLWVLKWWSHLLHLLSVRRWNNQLRLWCKELRMIFTNSLQISKWILRNFLLKIFLSQEVWMV